LSSPSTTQSSGSSNSKWVHCMSRRKGRTRSVWRKRKKNGRGKRKQKLVDIRWQRRKKPRGRKQWRKRKPRTLRRWRKKRSWGKGQVQPVALKRKKPTEHQRLELLPLYLDSSSHPDSSSRDQDSSGEPSFSHSKCQHQLPAWFQGYSDSSSDSQVAKRMMILCCALSAILGSQLVPQRPSSRWIVRSVVLLCFPKQQCFTTIYL